MRKVTLSNGCELDIRPMTVREIRDGEQYGFGPMQWRGTKENFDQACFFCVGKQFKDEVFQDLPAADMRLAFNAILKETYSDPGEEKNSPTSGPGAQTKSESSGAGNA